MPAIVIAAAPLLGLLQFEKQFLLGTTPPKMESAGQNLNSPSVLIAINQGVGIYFNDLAMSLDDLRSALLQIDDRQRDILPMADGESSLTLTTSVLDICRQLRFPARAIANTSIGNNSKIRDIHHCISSVIYNYPDGAS